MNFCFYFVFKYSINLYSTLKSMCTKYFLNQTTFNPLSSNLEASLSMQLTKQASLRLRCLYCENSQCSFVALTMISSRPEYTISISFAPVNYFIKGEFGGKLYPNILSKLVFCYSWYFFVIRPGLTWFKFLSHSKYETVTPPTLASMSGITWTPILKSIWSALKVVGPLAPSNTTLAFNDPALNWFKEPSVAHGAKISHYFLKIAFGLIVSITSACE